MIVRLWPRSLAARTALVLLIGLVLVQVAGLTIHAMDRLDVLRIAQARNVAIRVSTIYRAMLATPPDRRVAVLNDLHRNSDITASISDRPPSTDLPAMPFPEQRPFRVYLNGPPFGPPPAEAALPPPVTPDEAGPPGLGVPRGRWREIMIFGGEPWHRLIVQEKLPDGAWISVGLKLEPLRPWHSRPFLGAFALMTIAAAGLTVWAVRQLTSPVRVLAAAAEALGRDVNAPPLPENGPTEVATAAVAFNTMAARIRRFVQDRTELLTAIGHDLRTPITRLKLRSEFVDDEELRTKFLADLEELEAMVSATLAFGRDARTTEPVSSLDLAELLRTILDEAGDARPDLLHKLSYDGPAHLTVQARPLSLKRALVNLVSNAMNYGGSAIVRLLPPSNRALVVEVDDNGPGIAAGELERVFEPFHRGEPSRNRETGGVGLGLPIARNIVRAHGGDITLANRPGGGIKATVTLPA
jgi:signal transduction histidine kinase